MDDKARLRLMGRVALFFAALCFVGCIWSWLSAIGEPSDWLQLWQVAIGTLNLWLSKVHFQNWLRCASALRE